MDILNFIKQQADSFQRGVASNIPKPLRRFAGQVKLPTQINPFATSTPTTRLGKLGKAVNPLNPLNVRNSLITAGLEKILETTGLTEDPDINAAFQIGLFSPLAGIATLGVSGGAAGAAPVRERQLIEQSEQYFASQAMQNKTQAPPPQPGPRVDASTTQSQFYTRAPQQSPRVVPVVATAPPTQASISQDTLAAAQSGFAAPTNVSLADFYGAQEQLGSQLAKTGELQQRLQESGLTGEGLSEWARANPALAYREIMKRQKQPTPSVD